MLPAARLPLARQVENKGTSRSAQHALTPLVRALMCGRHACVKALLAAGASAKVVSEETYWAKNVAPLAVLAQQAVATQKGPYDSAGCGDYQECARLIGAAGSDPSVVDSNGKAALVCVFETNDHLAGPFLDAWLPKASEAAKKATLAVLTPEVLQQYPNAIAHYQKLGGEVSGQMLVDMAVPRWGAVDVAQLKSGLAKGGRPSKVALAELVNRVCTEGLQACKDAGVDIAGFVTSDLGCIGIDDGFTLLHVCAQAGARDFDFPQYNRTVEARVATTRLLLALGVDKAARNKDGKTALDIVKAYEHDLAKETKKQLMEVLK